MAITSLGDLANARLLRRQSAEAKAQIQTLSEEMTTGLAKDRARHLGADLSPLAGIETSLLRLRGHSSAATALSMAAGATQIALQTIGAKALEASSLMLTVTASTSQSQLGIVAEGAVRHLETVVSSLNTRFSDRSLFAGQATNEAAMIPASDLLDLLEGVVAGALSGAEAETLIADWFADPAGFAAQAYLGADPLAPIAVAPGEVAVLDLTVMDPAILDTLKALVLPALVDRGFLAGQPVAQATLMQDTGVRLLELQSSWADTAARLGLTEAQLDTALARNGAETSALELARLDLIGVDPFETASRLEGVQTQLETIYALTARIQRLNLTDYL